MSSASHDLPKLWVQDDDRTDWSDELSQSYSAEFVNGERPYNVYTVSLDSAGNYEPLYLPGSAMANGESYTFSKSQHGRAMFSHCLTKMWVPKCFGAMAQALYDELHTMTLKDATGQIVLDRRGNPKYDSKKVKSKIMNTVITDEVAEAFVDMCVKYTLVCKFKTGIVREPKRMTMNLSWILPSRKVSRKQECLRISFVKICVRVVLHRIREVLLRVMNC